LATGAAKSWADGWSCSCAGGATVGAQRSGPLKKLRLYHCRPSAVDGGTTG
jgi:hypothetical protein